MGEHRDVKPAVWQGTATGKRNSTRVDEAVVAPQQLMLHMNSVEVAHCLLSKSEFSKLSRCDSTLIKAA
jgi:hypothetical protein